MASKKVVQTPLVCHGHTRPIVELQFSPVTPDGYFLASASKDGQPMLRNGETGDWIGTFQGHKGAVWSCVLNDTAVLAATASADFTARVWNATTGDELHQFQHKHIVRSVSFARGDSTWQVCTGGAEKLLRIYDLQRPDAAPTGTQGRSAWGPCSLLDPHTRPKAAWRVAHRARWLASARVLRPFLLCCHAKLALSGAPSNASRPAEMGPTHDNIRSTHWIGDNKLLLVSYIDKPNVE
jgi:WD40 repeat protein